MPLKKPINDLKIAILVPCYRRPEYTLKCVQAINKAEDVGDTVYFLVDDCSEDGTDKILQDCEKKHIYVRNEKNIGLRSVIIDFFEKTKDNFDIIGKIDNDCEVPKDYLMGILKVFEKAQVDILSPNVIPSNAAYINGRDGEDGYRPSKHVGGLWFMSTDLVKNMIFEKLPLAGFVGAFSLLKQIISINDAVVGWVAEVNVQDIGHWTGDHPNHIKSLQHRAYYHEVDRKTGW